MKSYREYCREMIEPAFHTEWKIAVYNISALTAEVLVDEALFWLLYYILYLFILS